MPLRVAAVHAAPAFMDRDASLAKAISIIKDAGKQSIDLLVFPESFIPGYPLFIMSHPPFSVLPLLPLFASQSLPLLDPLDPSKPSPEVLRLASACGEAHVGAVIGVSERASFSDATLFNSQLFLSARGEVLGAHRKLQPTFAERAVWAQGGGATLRTWEVGSESSKAGGGAYRLGGLVCAENRMPGAVGAMAEMGESVHAASWPAMCAYDSTKGLYVDHIRTMAKAHANLVGSGVVAASCIVGKEILQWVEERLGKDHAGILCEGSGWSGVVAPDGRVLAEEEGGLEDRLVVAELDLGGIPQAKAIVDPAGHYSRPEVLKLVVNREVLWKDDEVVANGGSKGKGEEGS